MRSLLSIVEIKLEVERDPRSKITHSRSKDCSSVVIRLETWTLKCLTSLPRRLIINGASVHRILSVGCL